MTWQDVVIPILRGLINDFSLPYTYSDGRLEEFVVYSAHLLLNEVTFDNTYTITIPALTISPDPSSDVGFVNLVSLKAACLILLGELKDGVMKAIKVVDGPSTLDLSMTYKARKDLYDTLDKLYNKAKTDHALGNNGSGLGKAVMGPITIESVSPYLI